MFKAKIITYNNIFYDNFADKVFFNVEKKGQFGILTNHIDAVFNISPSICYVFFNNKKYEFLCGYGFASMKDNVLNLTSNIITLNFEEYAKACANFKNYGKDCLKNFKRVKL